MTWRKTMLAVALAGLVSAFAHAATPESVTVPPSPAAPAPKPSAAPVVLDGKTLFYIRETVLSVRPEVRARDFSQRLAILLESRTLSPDAVKVVDDEMASLIVAEGSVIGRVFDRDGAAEGTTRQVLAARFAERLRAGIEDHNEAYSFRSILFATIYAVLATGALVAIMLLCRHLFPRIYARIGAWSGTRIRSIHVGRYEVLHATQVTAILISLVRWVRILTAAALAYVWFLYVLSLFPWTREISSAILGYILDPLRKFGAAILMALPDVFVLAVIGIIMSYFIKLARFIFEEIEKGRIAVPGFYSDWAIPTFKIVRFFILAFAVAIALPYIPGYKSEAFKGVTIFLGLLFSLGSTSVIANLMGGLSITYMRAFKTGDRVQIGDTVGDVIDQSLLVTHLRTIKNEDVTVPNSMVLNAHIVNYSARAKAEGLILHTSVTIGYNAPWRTVHELLLEATRRTPYLLMDPKPFVLQTALNDFYVTYELNAYTDEPQQMVNTYSTLHRHIQDAFNEAGVEIMSPHYTQLRDGNRTAIPDAYLAPDYRPRAIRVEPVAESRGEGGGTRNAERKPPEA